MEAAQSAPVEVKVLHITKWQSVPPIKGDLGMKSKGNYNSFALAGRMKALVCAGGAADKEFFPFGKHRRTRDYFKIKTKLVLLKR